MSETLLLLGGTSDIGGEMASRLCRGRPVVLAGRSPERMQPVAERLRRLGAASVQIIEWDATELDSHRRLVEQAGGAAITDAIVAFGILGEQERAEHEEQHAAEIAHIDYVAQVSMLTVLADVMRSGTIYAFSSIAGWRARRANYVYGSTKAGLDAFCQGLTDRLHGTEVHLLTARPGFVIGSMTTGMSPAPLSSTPDQVAEAVLAARGRSATVWVPRRLRLLAWIMSLVPRPVWRRMPR
ncbi:SDR family oxidoreductase [Corynebacterium sp. TAE3-ERU2]|uniref:SDR family oxidoreductase n=1 Tax=Corynebacterium sp. TAE3-ERU2 TaxID=2849497 RepID=UPI001C482152|nr:SDR family oxidoreductase [Corynebacterium sp. TAE3-ERU2]MBV7302586.1 SDR family oxidoreductase [Corynebacterium sp. TAE3-ERU2]